MQPFDSLTEAGKIRRLRPLAAAALKHFPVQPTRMRLVGGFTNVLFRVDTLDDTYALRVDLHRDHSDRDVEIELAWLQALSTETDLDVAVSVPTTSGRPFVSVGTPGVPGERRCVLFRWIPGKPLAEAPSSARYHQLGRLSAQLHLHGAGYTPTPEPMRWDRVFYWPEEVDPVVIHKPEMAHHFGGDRRRILERSIEVVEKAFSRLDPSARQIIHADLHPWNVHVRRSAMIALDFEDVAMGHRVQDVAITLYHRRDEPDYQDFAAAFQEGYCTVAPWPASYDGEIEHFIAARGLMFVNYVANLMADPSEFYDSAFPRLQQFLETYDG